MSLSYYRLLLAAVASLSLLTAGCGTVRPEADAMPPDPSQTAKKAAKPEELDTESTIFTVLGLAKRPSQSAIGPQTGATVSPILWQAAHDTLSFVQTSAEDSETGVLATEWYSPKGKPNERLRVNVYILSRALRSDSLTVTVDRQERAATGQWRDTSVSQEVASDLENAILLRARQIRAETYRSMM